MGLFDFLGPLNAGKWRGWDALPSPAAEAKAAPTVRPLAMFGPGAVFYDAAASTRSLDPSGSSAVEACLGVLAASVSEPPLAPYRPGPKGGAERVPAPLPNLSTLLARPNPALTLASMLAYVAVATRTDGNGYWRKIRSGDPERGNVVELWPVCPSRIEPFTRPGSSDFISGYRYTDEHGRAEELPTANVVHFRYGIDPADHRLGYAPLRKLTAEVSSDLQATRYASRLLANLAINGLTLTFDKDAPPIDQATADELKARIAAAYGGENVGATAVLSPGSTLSALGFSPEQMDMKTLHRVPEERISAVLGVPAIVAGLGAGLDRSTFSNFEEAREAFTELTLVPLWRALAATLTTSLVPDFTSERAVFVDFDTSNVRALQEDQDKLATRLVTLVAGGILTVDEARAELDRPPLPAATAPASLPPAAVRARPYVMRLPSRKAAEDLIAGYDDLRQASLADWERELRAFFRAQAARVAGRAADGERTAFALVPESEAVQLRATLSPLQLALLDDLVPLVVTELGIAFQLDDPGTRDYLRAAGVNIGGITETTRSAVQTALVEGQAAGEGIADLARRLRSLPAFDAARAALVARTELGVAQNTAALAAYGASGVVVGVRVLDGDSDAACAAMNGRVFTLEQPPAALEHPQCVRAFAPLTDVADLAASA